MPTWIVMMVTETYSFKQENHFELDARFIVSMEVVILTGVRLFILKYVLASLFYLIWIESHSNLMDEMIVKKIVKTSSGFIL